MLPARAVSYQPYWQTAFFSGRSHLVDHQAAITAHGDRVALSYPHIRTLGGYMPELHMPSGDQIGRRRAREPNPPLTTASSRRLDTVSRTSTPCGGSTSGQASNTRVLICTRPAEVSDSAT